MRHTKVACHIHVSLVPALTATRRSGIKSYFILQNYLGVVERRNEVHWLKSQGCRPVDLDLGGATCSLYTCVMCDCVISASAYTSAGRLSLKQNGVFTFVITSGCTDLHTAHVSHIGSGAELLLLSLIHTVQRHNTLACSKQRQDLLATE